jgi:hypothetical protein
MVINILSMLSHSSNQSILGIFIMIFSIAVHTALFVRVSIADFTVRSNFRRDLQAPGTQIWPNIGDVHSDHL